MKKREVVVLKCMLFAFLCDQANAIEIPNGNKILSSLGINPEKVYTKMNVKFGYSATFYQSWINQLIQESKDPTQSVVHSLNLSIGVDTFYKYKDWAHPFLGVELAGSNNFNNEFIKDSKFNQYLNVNFRFGSTFKINEDLALRPYGLIGFNISEIKYTKNPEEAPQPVNGSITTAGAGTASILALYNLTGDERKPIDKNTNNLLSDDDKQPLKPLSVNDHGISNLTGDEGKEVENGGIGIEENNNNTDMTIDFKDKKILTNKTNDGFTYYYYDLNGDGKIDANDKLFKTEKREFNKETGKLTVKYYLDKEATKMYEVREYEQISNNSKDKYNELSYKQGTIYITDKDGNLVQNGSIKNNEINYLREFDISGKMIKDYKYDSIENRIRLYKYDNSGKLVKKEGYVDTNGDGIIDEKTDKVSLVKS